MRPTDLGRMTLLDLAHMEAGVSEVKGSAHNPRIVGWLQRVGAWADADEVPWCSAFVAEIAHRGGCCESRSLRARSWLNVGQRIEREDAVPGMDIVILNRGGSVDPTVIAAPGHVGFYAGHHGNTDRVRVFGGNQGDEVRVSGYPGRDVLGYRRLYRI